MAQNDPIARFISSSIAAIVAETITLPSDVAKVRLQVQKTSEYNGMIDVFKKTYHREGIKGLWKGLSPALLRQVSYSSMSLVLYEPIRNSLVNAKEVETNNIPFYKRLLAAGTAGGISIACMNPTEVLKTQMQTSEKNSKSMMQVYRSVLKYDGIKGFWAGCGPNVLRTFLVQAAEIGVYDQAKTALIPYVGGDNFWAHLGGSGIAGLASAITSTPADVIKTRFMNNAGSKKEYNNLFHAAKSIINQEGFKGLYKGFTPILLRKLVWVSSFFVVYEQIRPLIHID